MTRILLLSSFCNKIYTRNNFIESIRPQCFRIVCFVNDVRIHRNTPFYTYRLNRVVFCDIFVFIQCIFGLNLGVLNKINHTFIITCPFITTSDGSVSLICDQQQIIPLRWAHSCKYSVCVRVRPPPQLANFLTESTLFQSTDLDISALIS